MFCWVVNDWLIHGKETDVSTGSSGDMEDQSGELC